MEFTGRETCLICDSGLNGDIETTAESEHGSAFYSSSGILKKDLNVYFILKHVLELPTEQLGSYLKQSPYPLRELVKICLNCRQQHVDKCLTMFVELMEVKRRFTEARMELIEVIVKSRQDLPSSGAAAKSMEENFKVDIRKQIRRFVGQCEYRCNLINPFIAGDRMAKNKVAANNRKGKASCPSVLSPQETFHLNENDCITTADNVEDEEIKVKTETTFEDEWAPPFTPTDISPGDPLGIDPRTGTNDLSSDDISEVEKEILSARNEEPMSNLGEVVSSYSDEGSNFDTSEESQSETDSDLSEEDEKYKKKKRSNNKAIANNKSRRLKATTPTPGRKIDGKHRYKFNCNQCDTSCRTGQHLRAHQIRTHKTNLFECTECSWKGVANYLLTNHMKRHNSHETCLKEVTCPICQKILSTKHTLNKHIFKCHNDKREKFQCEYCDKCFNTKDGLLYHQGTVHGMTELLIYKCSFEGCEKAFVKKGHLRDHEPVHKPPRYECEICGETFPFKSTFRRHLEQHKLKGTRPFQCELCPASFARNDNLKAHERKMHKEDGSSDKVATGPILKQPRQTFSCSKCSLTFSFRTALKRHMDKKHEGAQESAADALKSKETEFQCTECSLAYKTMVRLRQHQIHIHKTNFYCCRICEWKTDTYANICKHRREWHRHKMEAAPKRKKFPKEGQDNFRCDHCDKEYLNKAMLFTHMGLVHGIKDQFKFHCKYEGCGKSFYLKSQLEDHEDGHQASNIQCAECGQLLSTRKLLKKHMVLRHVNEKTRPFLCEHCPASFSLRSTLKTHMKKKHNSDGPQLGQVDKNRTREPKNLVCSECGEEFQERRELRQHMEKVHVPIASANETFHCSLCGNVFLSSSALDKHSAEMHKKPNKVRCDLCGIICWKYYMKKHKYKVHQIGNMKLVNYPCTVEGCDKTFKTKSQQKNHILFTHEGQQPPFQCEHCGKRAVTRVHLRRHIQAMHTNRESKPFKCEECGKGFAISEYLWLHKKTHQPK